ncbi:MAG: VWA domain-containing protein [Deltaproteobacteria bacterium]|nr:VWA domain-containing protein [Deltaproteobacteria bacterium]
MRKTIALFGLALTLMLVAFFTRLTTGPTPTPTPPPNTTPTPDVSAPTVTNMPQPVGSSIQTLTLGEVVRLKAQLERGFVLAGAQQPTRILIDLDAIDAPTQSRPSLAVALVIDRSGSMAGEKMMRAREAAKALVARLLDDDQVALISYASDFSEDVPLVRIKGQRERIARAIDRLLDGGGTNLGGGLTAAIKALTGPTIHAEARRVILLSDGNANQGVTDPATLAQRVQAARQDGITVSTLGLGLDFNEDLMTLIAESAGGGYYYARNAEAIDDAFEAELNGLTKLAARTVEVGFELGENDSVATVYGYRTELHQGRIVLPVGDMSAGEHRRIMVELSLAPRKAGGSANVGVVLTYATPGDDALREHRGSVRAAVTANATEVAQSTDRNVVEAFEAAAAARARKEAASAFQQGHRANALTQLRKQLESTKSRGAALNSAVLRSQAAEIQNAIDEVEKSDASSERGRDLIKQEKLRARKIFAY